MNKRKKIIALDVDDVCLDLATHWLYKYNIIYNDRVKKDAIKTWDISSYTTLKDNPEEFYSLLNGQLYRGISQVVGAVDGVNKIRANYRVIFVTSNFADIGRPKFDALNRIGFNVNKKDYFECSDKSLISYDVLFDDNIDNVQNAYMGRGVLFTQPWNQLNNTNPRVNDWKQLLWFVERMELI